MPATNPKLAAALAEEGIAKVDSNADPEWKEAALECVVLTAFDNEYLLADDVWNLLLSTYPHLHVHNKSALGPIMREAISMKVIMQPMCSHCGQKMYKLSSTPGNHRGPLRLWKSLIYSK